MLPLRLLITSTTAFTPLYPVAPYLTQTWTWKKKVGAAQHTILWRWISRNQKALKQTNKQTNKQKMIKLHRRRRCCWRPEGVCVAAQIPYRSPARRVGRSRCGPRAEPATSAGIVPWSPPGTTKQSMRKKNDERSHNRTKKRTTKYKRNKPTNKPTNRKKNNKITKSEP